RSSLFTIISKLTMKPFAFTALLALLSILLATSKISIQAAPGCRPTTLAVQYPTGGWYYKNSVWIQWTVNSQYDDIMYLDKYPTNWTCHKSGVWCVIGGFWTTTGYPWMTIQYKGMTRGYSEVHVWTESNDEWKAVEYWDCV
ncbi:hypothetical protein BGZ52_008094, partial [Haplosporangium bisporale]